MLSRINPDNLTNDIPSVEYLAQLKADDTINKKLLVQSDNANH